MRPLCVIPARAGSKRLTRKNVAMLGGKPVVAWTIEAARDSGVFDRVYVSTEAADIAELAQGYGADVSIRRPVELAGDTITNVDVSLHLLEALAARGENHDAIYCLQPSSPLRNGQDIAEAWRTFASSGKDFLASVTPIDPHYFHWALEAKDDGNYAMVFGDKYMRARQELPEFYRPNGAIKIARVEALRARRNFFGKSLAIHSMDESRSVHVATSTDLVFCEALVQSCRQTRSN
jgi:CMP-N-acetylneuraminic acid synthetase